MNIRTINTSIAEQVEKLGSAKVVDSVVEQLVNKEVTRRSEILATAVSVSETFNKELRKALRPDQVFIDAAGVKTETFTKSGYESKGKVEQKILKLNSLVEKAIEKSEWAELSQFLANKDKPESNEPRDDTV